MRPFYVLGKIKTKEYSTGMMSESHIRKVLLTAIKARTELAQTQEEGSDPKTQQLTR